MFAESQSGFWLDGGYAFAATEGDDYGITLESTLTRTDEGAAVLDVVASPGPFVVLAPLDREVWVLSEPTDREYGDPEPPATDRILWRLGATGFAVDLTLPSGAAPTDLVTGGGYAWVFDEAATVSLFDGTGALVGTCTLAGGLGDGTRAASDLGAVFLDATGRPSVVGADCTVTALSGAAAAWAIAGADDAWLYVAAELGPGAGFSTTPALLALEPSTLDEAGRIPTNRTPLVVPGERVAVFDTALILADRP